MPRDAHALSIRAMLAFGLALASLQGCVKQHPAATAEQAPPDARTDDQMVEQLRGGGVTLSCGAPCEAAWTAGRAKVKSLYDAQDWRALAAAVTRIGFEQDLGYFYLGRASEELRFYDAALAYYRTAVHLSTEGDPAARCRGKSDRCDGVTLPADALPRLSIAATQQARARALASARRYGSGKYAPANGAAGSNASKPDLPQGDDSQAGGMLIDPPPVTR